VPGDHDIDVRRPREQVEFLDVMQYMDADTLQGQRQVERNRGCPCPLVVIPPDGVDRGDVPQRLEDFGSADVAGVNDVADSRECTDCFRAKQSVRIGNEAYRIQRP
jgi:hypothetical protein